MILTLFSIWLDVKYKHYGQVRDGCKGQKACTHKVPMSDINVTILFSQSWMLENGWVS